jgi:hypothetical protein
LWSLRRIDKKANMNSQEELTDLSDLPECICAGWVFTDEPRREVLWWFESLDWVEWYDLEILQAWVTLNAAEA